MVDEEFRSLVYRMYQYEYRPSRDKSRHSSWGINKSIIIELSSIRDSIYHHYSVRYHYRYTEYSFDTDTLNHGFNPFPLPLGSH